MMYERGYLKDIIEGEREILRWWGVRGERMCWGVGFVEELCG